MTELKSHFGVLLAFTLNAIKNTIKTAKNFFIFLLPHKTL